MPRIGFDNEKYLREQTQAILERVQQARGKLYLEFGGKLTFDFHAARVLPGYDPNVKMRLLQGLRDQVDVLFCIYSEDIEQGRIRGDFGITYDMATLKANDDLRPWGIGVDQQESCNGLHVEVDRYALAGRQLDGLAAFVEAREGCRDQMAARWQVREDQGRGITELAVA